MSTSESPGFPGKSAASRDALAPARGFARFLYCQNPFYVVSAALVFSGLRMSFETQERGFDVAGLLSSLAAYTLLLATTAWFLIRVGKVWDDVRSLLMLVALMFLAISVTLDDALAARPSRGAWYCLGGWLFAAGLSEALLWGLGIRLRAAYRAPYHVALALLFLYPVLLVPVMDQPQSPLLQWGLFGFPLLAALATLTLLPAVRRGSDYVANNGTPWIWPLFPWSLFFVLGIGMCLRSYYLCLSLHFVKGPGSIFGWYFLSPMLAAINVLLLERAIVTRSVTLRQWAMCFPAVWIALAGFGHSQDVVYTGFLALFRDALRASPLFVSVGAACLLYLYAAWRRVPESLSYLTCGLLLFVLVDRQTIQWTSPQALQAWPLVLAGLLQAVLAAQKRSSPRAAFAAVLWTAAVGVAVEGTPAGVYQVQLVAHFALVAALVLAFVFDDGLARFLRRAGAAALVLFCAANLFTDLQFARMPARLAAVYPGQLIALALLMGLLLRDRLFGMVISIDATLWLAALGWDQYELMRRYLPGLDLIVWGLAFFLTAAIISLVKAGVLHRGTLRWLVSGPPRTTMEDS